MSTPDTPSPARLPDVPNQPKTPMRSFRLANDLWEQLKQIATAEGITVSDLLRRIIENYLRRH